jgi:hypothetical protein
MDRIDRIFSGFAGLSIKMKHRAASRAVSRIATPKNCAASPRFVIAQVPGYNGNLCTPAGQAAGYSSSRESGIKNHPVHPVKIPIILSMIFYPPPV